MSDIETGGPAFPVPSISDIRKKVERRYLCERCGGTGVQPEGSYSLRSGKYDEPSGMCLPCNGEGYLGYVGVDHASVVKLLDLIDRMKGLIVDLEHRWESVANSHAWIDKKEAILKELEEA